MPNILPRVNLASAGFTPATFQGNTFTPQQADMSLLARSLDKMEQREISTRQQKSAITKALGDIKLNAAEDQWKQDYINSIHDQINGLIEVGDYSNALNRAIELAGEATTNPEFLAKKEENENYESWKKNVDALYMNNKINKDTRDYYLATNNYSFSGKYDNNGKFLGHELTEYDNPVQTVELSGLFNWVAQTVAEQSGSSQGVGARTATGGQSEYYSPDAAVLTHSGNAWSRKDYTTIKAVWDEAMKRHPEAIRYLEQQMEVNEWLLDKVNTQLLDETLDDKTRQRLLDDKARLENDLYVNGDLSKPYTPQEYLVASSEKTLQSMAYSRQNSTFNVSGGGTGRGAGYGLNPSGGFTSLNFTPSQAGPSGLITNAIMNKLGPTISIGSGRDIQNAINGGKK